MNRNALLLLTSIGLTGIGSWIYFIALNLMIFNQTGSAAAVGLLYIIRPAAALLTSFWCGSLVDRVQKTLLTGVFALLVFSFPLRQIVLSGVSLMFVITICLALTVPGTHAKRNILSTFLHFTHVKRRILK